MVSPARGCSYCGGRKCAMVVEGRRCIVVSLSKHILTIACVVSCKCHISFTCRHVHDTVFSFFCTLHYVILRKRFGASKKSAEFESALPGPLRAA